MSRKHKPLDQQVIVITGASSGIGFATAPAAARAGAKLVLAARSERTLDDLIHRLTSVGAEAVAVPCDVADYAQVEHVAHAALERFGRARARQQTRDEPPRNPPGALYQPSEATGAAGRARGAGPADSRADHDPPPRRPEKSPAREPR